MDLPLRFVPYFRPMVWGGRRLGLVLGKQLPSDEPYGESWEISDHPLHRSRVACGPYAGQSLHELMETERQALLGAGHASQTTFPWLVKFLDACDWLSVQVHPDEKAVVKLWPGDGRPSGAKTEAWFVLDAAPGSRIYAGLLPGVDEKRLRAALEAGTVADCLHRFEPHPGDCVFLPAGTVHAVGGGVLLAEVQQTSDATFRLFDWNRRDAQGRSRPLHIEQALACIDWNRGPVRPVHVVDFAGLSVVSGPSSVGEMNNGPLTTDNGPLNSSHFRQSLVRCPYLDWDYVRHGEPFTCGGEGLLQLLIILRGKGSLVTPAAQEELEAGQAWLLPASMPPLWIEPKSDLAALLCSWPCSS